MEFDAYQEDMSVEYIEGGTRALNMLNWAGEATGDGLLPDRAPYSQPIFTALQEMTGEHAWPVSHALSSFDSEMGPQIAQIHQGLPPTDYIDPSPTVMLNSQISVNYPRSHHLDP